MPAFEYDVFVNGNWEIELKTGGEFYKYFDLDKHTGVCEYDPTKPIHVSFDENVNPYITATVFQLTNETELKQINEFCLESRTTPFESCVNQSREHIETIRPGCLYTATQRQKKRIQNWKRDTIFSL